MVLQQQQKIQQPIRFQYANSAISAFSDDKGIATYMFNNHLNNFIFNEQKKRNIAFKTSFCLTG